MRKVSPHRLSQISIGIVLLALLRTVGEYYRLQYLLGADAALRAYQPFIGGLAIATVGLVVAVVCYFFSANRTSTIACVVTIAAMLAYKIGFIT